MTSTTDPFWSRSRVPYPRLLAWAGGATALAMLVGALAHIARQQALALQPGLTLHPLGRHVAGMVLLGALAVAVATVLARSGSRVLAGLVLVATAAGSGRLWWPRRCAVRSSPTT